MESINSALPVQLTRGASLRAHEGTHLVGATGFGATVNGAIGFGVTARGVTASAPKVWASSAVIGTTVGVTPSYQGTAMPFAGRGRTTTDSLSHVDGLLTCAPPD